MGKLRQALFVQRNRAMRRGGTRAWLPHMDTATDFINRAPIKFGQSRNYCFFFGEHANAKRRAAEFLNSSKRAGAPCSL